MQQRTSIAIIIVELSLVEFPFFEYIRGHDFAVAPNANLQDFIQI